MKARDVLKLLNVSRVTLYNYVRYKKIKCTKLQNGTYDYDDESVMSLLKKDIRVSAIYSRVSTKKQKNDLDRQTKKLEQYALDNNIKDYKIYSDISSGIDFDRTSFNKLLEDIIHLKIKDVIISNRDRLTRLSFKTMEYIFSKFNTKIIIVNDNNNKSNDSEIFEELISLMHIFSTTMYSKRRKTKINIYKQDIENFIAPEK